jgi:hypothetical protein
MALQATGQITLLDYDDAVSLSSFLSSNVQRTQITSAAESALAQPAASGATQITVTAGTGSRFTSGRTVTLGGQTLTISAISGDTLTVTALSAARNIGDEVVEATQYTPNWASTNAVLTPSLFSNSYAGIDLLATGGTNQWTQVRKIEWFESTNVSAPIMSADVGVNSGTPSTATTNYTMGALNTTGKGALTIKQNLLTGSQYSISFICKITYRSPDTGLDYIITSDFTFNRTLVGEPGAPGAASIFAMMNYQGNLFKNGVGTIDLTGDLYMGGAIQNTGVTYQWYVSVPLQSSQLAVATANGNTSITVKTGEGSRFTPNTMVTLGSQTLTVTAVTGDVLTVSPAVNAVNAINAAVTNLGDDATTVQVGNGWRRLTSGTVGTYVITNPKNSSGTAATWPADGLNTAVKTLTVGAAGVINIRTYKFVATFNNNKYFDVVTIIDTTDPIKVDVLSSNGEIFRNGTITTTLYAKLFQSGSEIDAYSGSVQASAPASPVTDQKWYDTSLSTGNFKKWSGSAWVADTPTPTFLYTYKWTKYDQSGNQDTAYGTKTGKFLNVSAADVQNKATFRLEVEN